MSEPIHATVLRISHATEDELDRKLCAIMRARGYHVERAGAEMVTVGQLAKMTGRNLTNVSTKLRQPTCPPFESIRGKRKILRLRPTHRLLTYLTT